MNDTARRLAIVAGLLLALLAVAGPVLLVLRARESQAAFGDSETVGANHLGAATIDIEVGERSTVLTATNMAPGDTAVGWLDLRNSGDLRLRYSIVTDNTGDVLLGHLLWELWTATETCISPPPGAAVLIDRVRLRAGSGEAFLGSPAIGPDPGDRELEPGERERLCLAATLPSDTPNEVQATTVTQTVHVVAEQAPDEGS